MNSQRLDFLDIAKGITVLWVVWMHMEMPMHIWACFQMPLFFFISGSLFKQPAAGKTMEWIKKKAQSLLIPALTFFFISTVILLIKQNNIEGENIVWKMHSICQASIIWFLQALFIYICTHTAIVKWVKWKYMGSFLSLLLYPIGYYLYGREYYNIIPCIPVAHILVNWIYFELGCLWGNNYSIITKKDNYKRRIIITIFALIFAVLVCTPILNEFCFRKIFNGENYLVPAYSMVYNLCMTYLVILFSSLVGKFKIAKLWKFYGINSLVVYLVHWPVYRHLIKPYIDNGLNIYLGFILVILIVTVCIFIFNNYFPTLIGKNK